MIAVIVAGGSGTRLWPLSTPGYPKHLLSINGDNKSLLQNTYDRAKKLTDKVYVVSESGHIHHVKEQLPDLPDAAFISEPARRGTASCIIASLVEIAKTADPDEPIAFLAADHYVRDVNGFSRSFKIASNISQKTSRLVLVGVEPDYPATGFGYIQKGDLLDEQLFVFNVHAFQEKPDYQTAVKYLRTGNYLWNCSYFIGSINTFMQAMQDYAPEQLRNFEALQSAGPDDYEQAYLNFETISIDYALIEKVKNLLVVPASFDWMDLGSFGDIAKAVGGDEIGNHTKGTVELNDVENSLIHNDEDKPVAVIGLDNVVVINTKQGLLVARKDLSQQVGEIAKKIQASKS